MAELQYINYGNTANDGTGDSLRNAFIKVDENFSAVWNAGPVGSNLTILNNSISAIDPNGEIQITPNGIGVIRLNGVIVPRSNNLYSIGTANNRFRSAYIGSGGLSIKGDIVAEGNITIRGNISGNIDVGNTITANIIGSVYGNDSIILVDAETGTHYGSFVGDGSLLVNVPVGSKVSNGNSNIEVYENGPVTTNIDGVSNVVVVESTAMTVTGNVVAEQFVGNGAPLTSTLTDRGQDTSNWDTLTQMGVYKVNRTSWSGTQGTPLDSSIYVGLLQVLTASNATTQIFLPGTVQLGDQKIQWNRSYWNGQWTGWIKMVNNGQVVDAGTY